MKKLFIISLTLLFFSCQKKVTESLISNTVQIQDSSHMRTDSTWTQPDTLRVLPDSIKIHAQVTADDSGRVNLPEIVITSQRSKASVSITNGKLKAECFCTELELIVQKQNRLLREQLTLIKDLQETKSLIRIKEVPVTPKWVRRLAWAGGASLILFAILLINWLKTKFLNKT